MSNPKGDIIPGIVTIVFGAFVGGITLSDPEKMFIGENAKKGFIPGPGFFPAICSAVLVILGILLLIRGLRQKGTMDYFAMTPEMKGNLKIVLFSLIGLVVFLLLWKFVSDLFILWIAIYTAYLCLVFRRGWLFTLIFTSVLTALVYFMFMVGFSVTFRVY